MTNENYYDAARRDYKYELINRGKTSEEAENFIEDWDVPEDMLEVYRKMYENNKIGAKDD